MAPDLSRASSPGPPRCGARSRIAGTTTVNPASTKPRTRLRPAGSPSVNPARSSGSWCASGITTTNGAATAARGSIHNPSPQTPSSTGQRTCQIRKASVRATSPGVSPVPNRSTNTGDTRGSTRPSMRRKLSRLGATDRSYASGEDVSRCQWAARPGLASTICRSTKAWAPSIKRPDRSASSQTRGAVPGRISTSPAPKP